MWRRRISKGLLHKREKAGHWANLHPKAVIAAMFSLMACGIIWLMLGRERAQHSFDGTARLLFSGSDTKQQARPVTAGMLQAWQLYSSLQRINPDSLSARDSTFLQDIDKQLNRIIHE
jgi:hypothetical protein